MSSFKRCTNLSLEIDFFSLAIFNLIFSLIGFALLISSCAPDLDANIKNEYDETEQIYSLSDKYMVDDALNSGYDFLLDHISQKEILRYLKTLGLDDKLFIINVFTNLKDLARNLLAGSKALGF